MREAKIATAFLEHNGSILILKRSKNVKTMKGKWAGISGYIENESPLDAAIREIKEETGIDKDKLRLLAKGDTIDVIDYENNTIWKVHPFLFYTYDTNIRLEKEHDKYKWIKPEEIINYDTVPKLKEALYSCLEHLKEDIHK
ncbi:MAG: hypothetical protein KatS3mg003_2361 [Candidatus Nitrosocaldaceae archaeon]|nr:MAG: hypothetical protein KatS3mg003_2153 [Candidatus Nitrosocaldaceae archaeon]GIU72882.1 MAG: hypothetical protein KatS3mg003_2361 [Candidatus Nitrosocaldaceae archaeon]